VPSLVSPFLGIDKDIPGPDGRPDPAPVERGRTVGAIVFTGSLVSRFELVL
jgi:hypothetical protein